MRLVAVAGPLGFTPFGFAAPPASGDRLLAGGDGRGPLSAGLSNYPLGAAFVHGPAASGRSPDLFVAAGRFSHEPGLFLYRWVATGSDGAPVFGPRLAVRQPGEEKVPPTGTIFQAKNGVIYGFWLIKGAIVRTRFDLEKRSFARLPLPPLKIEAAGGAVNPDNRSPGRFTVRENADGSLEVVMSVSDGTPFRPPGPPDYRDPAFQPFDGRGIWRGGWPYVHLRAGHLAGPEAKVAVLQDVREVSSTRHEALLSHGGLAIVNLGAGHEHDLVTGSHFGNFYYYRNRAPAGVDLAPQEIVRGPDGRVLRSPIISATPVAFGSGLIVGGEGALFFLAFAGFDADGRPRYAPPVAVLEERALLYTGSLPVVNATDWDGDGAVDLLVGTPRHGSVPNPKTGLPQSKGLPGSAVLWLRNTGSNDAPKFAFPRLLQEKGKPQYFGQHECSVAVTDLGGGGPNLVVGEEEGRVHFFRRADISWAP